MSEHTKPFVRGTLPSWFSAIMLAVLCFFGHRTMNEFDGVRRDEMATRERVQSLELRDGLREQRDALRDRTVEELRLAQKDILAELKTINATLISQQRKP